MVVRIHRRHLFFISICKTGSVLHADPYLIHERKRSVACGRGVARISHSSTEHQCGAVDTSAVDSGQTLTRDDLSCTLEVNYFVCFFVMLRMSRVIVAYVFLSLWFHPSTRRFASCSWVHLPMISISALIGTVTINLVYVAVQGVIFSSDFSGHKTVGGRTASKERKTLRVWSRKRLVLVVFGTGRYVLPARPCRNRLGAKPKCASGRLLFIH